MRPALAMQVVGALRPERVAGVLATLVTALVALGAAEYEWRFLALFELRHEFSAPGLVAGGVLLVAAIPALALGAAPASGPRRVAWKLIAVATGALGAELVLQLHERAQAEAGLDWGAAGGPVAVAGAVAFGAAAALLGASSSAAAVAVGGGAWLAGQVVEAAASQDGFAVAVVHPVLELGGAAVLVVGLVAGARRRLTEDGRSRPENLGDVLTAAVRRWPVGLVAGVMAAGIGALAVAGAVVKAHGTPYAFSMHGEQTLPATYSAVLLWVAAALCELLRRRSEDDASVRRLWGAMGVLFLFLGFDELAALHERVQDATGIYPGQIVLAPLVVVAAAGWLLTLRGLAALPRARALWIAGAVAWAASQAVDATQPKDTWVWQVVPEEALEMAGSGLFALALLVALQAPSAAPRPAAAAAR